MCKFYCINFIECMLGGKTLLDHSKTKQNLNILQKNLAEEASPEFGLRKIDETRNCLLEEIKHNDLMTEKI